VRLSRRRAAHRGWLTANTVQSWAVDCSHTREHGLEL